MVLAHHLLLSENEWGFVYNFFTATIVDNLFDNAGYFKNAENVFLIGIMKYNGHRRN